MSKLKAFMVGILMILGGVTQGESASAGWTNTNWYYAQTGIDGNIHCAGNRVQIYQSWETSLPGGEGITTAGWDYYCRYVETLPPGYIGVNAQLYIFPDNGGGSQYLCAESGYHWNTGYSSTSFAGIGRNCGAGWYYIKVNSFIAVNFDWRYGYVISEMVHWG